MATLPGKRVRDNSIFGTLTSSISAAAATINSSDLSDLSSISGDHAIITLDPFRQNGDPEIVMVTAHTAAATTATVQRGMYGTTARAHNAGTQWAHAATVEDFADVVTSGTLPSDQFEGQLVYQTDTDSYRYFDGLTWRALGAGSPGFLAYAENTTNQAAIGTGGADLTGLSVSVTVPSGRRLKITGYGGIPGSASTALSVNLAINEGATQLQRTDDHLPTAFTGGPSIVTAIISPSAGSHTYKLVGYSSTGTFTFNRSSTFPGYILVEDITGTETPFAGNSVPVGRIGYSESSVNQTGITTTETASNIPPVNISVPAGRVIKVTILLSFQDNTAGASAITKIYQDATPIRRDFQLPTTASSNVLEWSYIFSPAAGAHNYSVTLATTTATMTLQGTSHILVEDITPTPTAASGAPSSTLGYAENTNFNLDVVGATQTDLPGLSTTITVPAGRRLRVTGHVYVEAGAGSPGVPYLEIREGGTRLQLAQHYAGVVPDRATTLECSVVISPTAGSHTYKLQGGSNAGDTASFFGGSNFPAFILVEDITGSVWPQGSQVTSGIIASEAWLPWTPIVTQGVVVTVTVHAAKYYKVGRLVRFYADLAPSTNGTAGQQVLISGLPFVKAATPFNFDQVGAGIINDGSAADDITGLVRFGGNTTSLQMLSTRANGALGSVTFSAALTTGDRIIIEGAYEAVS